MPDGIVFRLIAAHLLLAWSWAAQATPYVSTDDASVLERLPLKATDPVARELGELRTRLAADPANSALAAMLARRYFRLGMAEGEPRHVGYGEAALRSWWARADASHDVIKMRALLNQHDFAGALADFAVAGDADASDEEIWS